MQKFASLVLSAGVTGLLLAGLAACNSHRPEATAAELPGARVAVAQRGDIARMMTLAGQFQPYQVVDVHPKVAGFIRKINVDIGDRVRKGDTLAVLEVPELAAQLKGAQYQLAETKDEIVRAQHEVKRAEALHAAQHADYQRLLDTSKAQPGLVAQQELDDEQAKDLSAEAQVDAVRAALAAAQQHAEVAHADSDRVQALENYTNVTAPIEGVITWRYADTGALIQAGTNSNEQDIPIVRLSQSGLLRLRMPVPEDDVRFIRLGDSITVRVDAIDRSFTGKVVRFTRSVNFETRTMETEVDVENRDLSIAPGMYANTMLQLENDQNVVTIPVEALVLRGPGQNAVLVLDSANRVRERKVTAGLRGEKLAEIKSGLDPGDRVIIGGQNKYEEGEQVNPVLEQEPASETIHETGGTIDMKQEEEETNKALSPG